MLIIISGPSGVGKGTLIRQLLTTIPNLSVSTSATTRAPRNGEIHGEDYHFLSPKAFTQKVDEHAFLEWCLVHRDYYGTLKSDVTQKLTQSPAVIIEIDVQGAQKIRQHTEFDQHHIFIAPPSMAVLKERLMGRNTESSDTIQRRLTQAKEELLQKDHYDTIIVNNELTQTCDELNNVVQTILGEGVTK